MQAPSRTTFSSGSISSRNLNTSPSALKITHTSNVKSGQPETMSHAALSPELQRMSPDQWRYISQMIVQQKKAGIKLKPALTKAFYKNVYAKASSSIQYTYSKSVDECQKEWSQLIIHARKNPQWKPGGITYGYCGKVPECKNNPDNFNKATLYLRYHSLPAQSRLQFVVRSNAGFTLYTDIAMAIDAFINMECDADHHFSPVISYKVMSETFQIARSDSAVIYLKATSSEACVKKLVTYLDDALGKRIAPVSVIGATDIGKCGIQAFNVPDHAFQRSIFGKKISSLGGFITCVLFKAYQKAGRERMKIDRHLENIDIDLLTQHAQFHAKNIWEQFYEDSSRQA